MTDPRFFLFGALVLAACNSGAVDDSDADTGSDFDADPSTILGGERPAPVMLPADYTPDREWPLVVLVHGYGVNSTLQDYVFGLKDRVDSEGFILVLPEGTVDSRGSQFWNATPECCDFDHTNIDDVGYLGGLIEEAETLYPIDRVSLVGHSNGGFMSYRMACERPDIIDSIVVLAGAVYADEADCIGTEPVSVLHIHGTLDAAVAYESFGTHAGAVESVGRWVTKAHCDETPTMLPSRNYTGAQAGDETTIARYDGCDDGIDVELWSTIGGDHTVLSRNDAFQNDVTSFALGHPPE